MLKFLIFALFPIYVVFGASISGECNRCSCKPRPTTTTQRTTTIKPKPENFCKLPKHIDKNENGGNGLSLVDCSDERLEKLVNSPRSIWALKGSYPMICCPSDKVTPPGVRGTDFCDTTDEVDAFNEYTYQEDYNDDGVIEEDPGCEPVEEEPPLEPYIYNSPDVCEAETVCTNGNKCGAKDFNNTVPPTSCGFDILTGEDMFCCKDLNGQTIKEPQRPRFKDKSGKAYPCMDQTPHCKRWATKPKACIPTPARPDDPTSQENNYSHYHFMREVCQGTCSEKEENFRSSKCSKGCVDEYENCPLWSRLGFCNARPEFMYFNCRESCGSCGFKSMLNEEKQFDVGKTQLQYSDINKKDDFSENIILVCGSEKAQPELTDAIAELLNSQIRDEETSLCTNVIISDKYALTVAHCVEGLEYDSRTADLSIKIREGTEYEEVIGVKRSWIYQYRKTAPACSQGPAYYDIAILELDVLVQGYGQQPNEEVGELLELELRTITNEECYGEFTAPENQATFNSANIGFASIRPALYNGITDEILCTKITCRGEDVCERGETENCLARFAKCDAGAGDSGAPIYTLGNELPSERTNITLVGLHAGGLSTQSGRDLQRAKVFFPKWNVRIAVYADWIKCVQKEAMEHDKRHRNVERACNKYLKQFKPNCDHSHLFFNDDPPQSRQPEFHTGKPVAPWLNDWTPYCNDTSEKL